MALTGSSAVAWLPHDGQPHDAQAARAACERGAAHVGARVVAWRAGELAEAIAACQAERAAWLVMPAPPAGAAGLEAALRARLGVRVAYGDGSTALSPAAAAELEAALEHVNEARRRRILATRPMRGTPPYGWRRCRGQLEEEPYEQGVLGRIAALRAEGLGARRIARELRARGYRNRRGECLWHYAFIYQLLVRKEPRPGR